jgi:Rho GTPase-activating protein RGD1
MQQQATSSFSNVSSTVSSQPPQIQPDTIIPVQTAPQIEPLRDTSPRPQPSFSQLQTPDRNVGSSQNPRFSFEPISQPKPQPTSQGYPEWQPPSQREEHVAFQPQPTPPQPQPMFNPNSFGQPPNFGANNNGPSVPSPLNPGRAAQRGANTVPTNPIFGVHIDTLFMRDSSPVPSVVFQCIMAVETFGLDHEGIYRISGNSQQVQEIKRKFDMDAASVDFRDPESFFHDVNLPASLLKQFFRELPETIFTRKNYEKFIDSAREEDEIKRRDGIHALINDLPDPNYATLRSLILVGFTAVLLQCANHSSILIVSSSTRQQTR